MRVWITKWALTRGVIVRDDAETGLSLGCIRVGSPYCSAFYGQDWHATPEAAAHRVWQMINAKMRSIDEQKRKLGELKRLLGMGECPGLEGVKA